MQWADDRMDWPRMRGRGLKAARVAAVAVGAGLSVAVGLVVLLLFVFQVTPVRVALADRVLGSLAEGDGITVTFDGYGGLWPVRLTAERVVVRDGGALLAEIEDLSLGWRPLALLSGEVHATEIVAARTIIHALPFGESDEDEDTRPGPLVPSLPVAVRVDELRLSEVMLASGVAGTETVVLTAQGRAGLAGRRADLSLSVTRTGGAPFNLSVAASLGEAVAPQIDISLRDGTVEQPGLVAALTGDPSLGTLDVTASSSGDLSDWTFDLAGQIGAYGDVTAIAQGPLGDNGRLATKLRFLPGAALADVKQVSLDGDLASEGGVHAMQDARLSYGETSYTGAVTLTDPLSAPKLRLSGQLAMLDALVGEQLPEPLTVDLDATSDAGLTRIEVTRLTLSAPGLMADMSGDIDLFADMASGQADVEISGTDLLPLGGDLTARVDVQRLDFAGALTGRLDARYAPALGPDGEPNAVLGEVVTLAGRFTGTASGGDGGTGSVETIVESLSLTPASGAFDIAATGRVSADASDLALTADADDLSVFSSLAGTPLGGRAKAEVTLTGALSAPQLAAAVDLDTARVAGVDLQGRLNADGRLTPAVDLTLAFNGRAAGETARASARVMQDQRETRLAEIEASLPGLVASGDVVLGPSGAVDADLGVDVASLDAVGRIAGVPLKGQGNLAIKSVSEETGSQMTAKGAFKRIKIADLWIGGARLDATLAPEETLDATVNLRSLAVGGAEADRVRIGINGTVQRPSVAFEASGVQPFDGASENGRLSGRGDIDVDGAKASLTELEGRLADVPFSVAQPVRLSYATGVSVEDLSLRLASGRVEGRLEQKPGRLDMDVSLAALPLSLVSVLTGAETGIGGTLEGTVKVSASGVHGEGTFNLTAAPVVPGAQVTPPRVAMEGTWDGAELVAELTAEMPGTRDLMGSARLPVGVRNGVPFLKERAALTASLSGVVDLGAVWPLVPVDGHRMAGLMDVDVSASGTLVDLDVAGGATMSDGLYENYDTGLLLSPLKVKLDGTGTGGTLEEDARDGAEGRLAGEGVLDLTDQSDNRLDVSMQMTRFRAARRDEVNAVASGTVTVLWPRGVDGAATPVTIGGDIQVDQLDARIPDKLASDVTVIDVTKVTGDGVPVDPEAEKSSEEEADDPPGIVLDVAINAPRRAFVRGRGLESEWSGALKVTGPADQPALVGKFEVLRGTFDFLGRSFNLSGGTVEFTGGQDVDPYLNVKAVYEEDGFQATVSVTGLASDPQIGLSSIPALPRDEILSRVLFGTGTGQLTALQAVQLADAAANLAGASSGGGVLDAMRRARGVDVLSFGDDGVEVGSYVRDGVYVGVAQGLDAGSGEVNVEVELTDDISLDGGVGTTGDTKVGVTWERDY